MAALRTIIVLIVFALFIQNTCPHGFAGKSTVANSCAHCSLKQQHDQSADSHEGFTAARRTVHYPFFVLTLTGPIQAYQRGPAVPVGPALAGQYTDALPFELLQPPRA